MGGSFEVRVGFQGGFSVVRLSGHFGMNAAGELSRSLAILIKEPKPYLALDFTDVEFWGSRAIGVLVETRSEILEKKGRLVMGYLPPLLLSSLRMSRLDGLFDIVEDLDLLLKSSKNILDQVNDFDDRKAQR